MVLRLPGVRRDKSLSPLSSAASCTHATGRRSRSDPFGAVSNHPAKLSPEILARHQRPDRLCAAQGAISQCARRQIHAPRAAGRALLGQAGPQIVFNLVFLAGLAAVGVWWAYPLLWLLPLVT